MSKTSETEDTRSVSRIEDVRSKKESREKWGSGLEFTFTTLGVSVGLGNIWRFPIMAYHNGGSAFLFPYLCCTLFFSLPVLYAEFFIGQYHRRTAPQVFKTMAPALEGFGWLMEVTSFLMITYYAIVIVWTMIYMIGVVSGHTDLWTQCGNEWNNDEFCYDSRSYLYCDLANSNYTEADGVTRFVYRNGTCFDSRLFANVSMVSATEQYFINYVVQPSKGLLDINSMNWTTLLISAVVWLLVIAILLQGLSILGKSSYLTVTLPYFIVLVILIRGLTLPGSYNGLYYFLGRPDWSKIFARTAWIEALKQNCFSLSLGIGAMTSMASYNRPTNNCFKDAIIVVVGDTIMSLLGGMSVFAILGFLAQQRGVEITEVVKDGFSLAFVVYPEAMAQMPLPFIWSFLYYFMLFTLGFSTLAAVAQVVCSVAYDASPSLKKRKWLVVIMTCFATWFVGAVMCTDAGYYWLAMFDEYTAGIPSVCGVLCEIIIISHFYGWKNIRDDMRETFGRGNVISRIIGPQSPFFLLSWSITGPIFAALLLVLCCLKSYPYNNDASKFPPLFDILGWFLAALPLLTAIACLFVRFIRWKSYGLSSSSFFKKQPTLKSYNRIFDDSSVNKPSTSESTLSNQE